MFQCKEPTVQDKSGTIGRSRLSGKQVTQESSQITSEFKSSKLSSPSHSAASSSIAQSSASKSSAKSRPAVSSKPTDTKTSVPAKTSGLRTPSKPSVKPKPTATSTSKTTSRISKPVSRSSSGRSQDGKSLSRSQDGKSLSHSQDSKSLSRSQDSKSLSRSLKPPIASTKPKTEPKVDIKQSPQRKVMNGKTTTSKAGLSQASGLCKSSIDSRSPSPKSDSGKIESPKTTRKFVTNAKSGIPSKSATRLSGKASMPLPVKPKPPPKTTSKSTNSKSTASKSASKAVGKQNVAPKVDSAEASSRKLSSPVLPPKPAEINDFPICKEFIDDQAQQETTYTCNQTPVSTSVNQTVTETSNNVDTVSIDKVKTPENTSHGTVDDEIYDDVIHLMDHSKNAILPSVIDPSNYPNGKEGNNIQKDGITSVPVVVASSMPLPFESSTTESKNAPLINKTVHDAPCIKNGTLAQSVFVHEVPPTKDEHISDIEHIADSNNKVSDNVQSTTVELPDLKPCSSEVEPAVHTADDIYDDVVVQNTATNTIGTTSHVEPVTLAADDIYDDVVHSNSATRSMKPTTSNEAEPVTLTADDIYDDVEHSSTAAGSMKLITSNEVEPVTLTADDIYDDMEHSNTTAGSMKLTTSNEPEVHTADDIYDDVLFPQVGHKASSEGSQCMHFSDIDIIPCQENAKKLSKSPSLQLQQIKEVGQSPQLQYVEETMAEMNYGNIHEMGDTGVKQSELQSSSDDDIEVVELTQSPRQSRVARFQRAVDKDFGCRDSGLGIEAYYDKIDIPSDVAIEPAFYDEINNREQLETISSTEDVLQTESSTEDVINFADLAPPPLPPRSDTMIEEKMIHDLPRHLVEESPKLIEATTVESGFEDQWLDGQNSEERGRSKQSAVEQESLQDNGNSPPPLPPRRPRSSLVSLEDKPNSPPIDKDISHRSRSGSPQVTTLPPRGSSSPQLHSSKELASSNSSLAPSHSAVSILSSRSENVTDVGSDASRPNSFVESGGETPSEHKKEKSKFSLGIFSRKKSDRRKKSVDKSTEKSTENTEEIEHIRPRASSLGHSLARKKSSRQAMKKKGSVPPELEYSLPDPIHIVGDEEYDDCTVIQNNWKSPPAQESTNADATIAHASLNDLGPEIKNVTQAASCSLENQREVKKSTESLGSFTQNFEDSSGWFDDIYDMVANSSTTSVTDGTPTIAVNNEDEIYDAVAPDLVPNTNKTSGLTVMVTDSPNLNKRASGESSYDSSGSFDSYDEENEGDELAPLNSELSPATIKGRTMPQRQSQAKSQSQYRPRSCSYNDANQIIQIVQTKRNIEEIKEVS